MSEILKGYGAPDINRTACLGDYYVDVDTESVYKLVDIKYNTVTRGQNFANATSHDGTYEFIWEACGGGSIFDDVDLSNAKVIDIRDDLETGTYHRIITEEIAEYDRYLVADAYTLQRLTFSNGLQSIGDEAFVNNDWLVKVDMPDTVTSIGISAFEGDSKLELDTLPKSLVNIGANAFFACSKATFTEIPEGVKTIGMGAFLDCTGLTTLTFKGTPESIGERAFERCTNLTTINVPWAEGAVIGAPWAATNAIINYNYAG